MKISIIIPCYNEEKDIKSNVEEKVLPFLKKLPIEYELLLVNDGSKDKTQEVIETIKGAKALGYPVNRGKGGAVKFGIEHSTGDYILFMDADLSTDLIAFDELVPLLGNYDLIIGSRHLKESKMPVKQPLIRRFVGKSCRIMVNTQYGFRLKDTQCGFKAIKSEIAKFIAEKQIVNGVAFSRNEAKVVILSVPDMPGVAASIFSHLAEEGVNVDMIVQNVSPDGKTTDMTFTVARSELFTAEEALKKTPLLKDAEIRTDGQVAKVSVIGIGMNSHVGVAKTMFQTLADKGINILAIGSSEIKISVLIKEDYVELAVRALHTAFDLESDSPSSS